MSRTAPSTERAARRATARAVLFNNCQEAPVGHALAGTFFQGARS
jgi:hypothetical protein